MLGQQIVGLHFIKGVENEIGGITDDGRVFRLPIETILSMVNAFEFTTEKRKDHFRISNAELLQDLS